MICGYTLRDRSYCKNEPGAGGRCEDHINQKCASCGRFDATHDCPADGTPLCEQCEHISSEVHGKRPSQQDIVLDELNRAMELALEKLNESERLPSTGPQRHDAAPFLVQWLVNHVALKTLSGIARPEKGDRP